MEIAERQQGQMKRPVLLLCVAVGLSMALVRAYSVEPGAHAQSGMTSRSAPNNRVGEVITISFDIPIRAALFVGAKQGNGAYSVSVYSYPDGNVALAQAIDVPVTGSHYWLNCSLSVTHPDSFIRGRRIEVRWTRTVPDSINYFYRTWDPYEYGYLKVGQTDHTGKDLCMRLYGEMNAVDSTYWGFSVGSPKYGADVTVRGALADDARWAGVRAARKGLTWNHVESESNPGTWDFRALDKAFTYIHDGIGCETYGLLLYGNRWASSRSDSSMRCAPLGLFYGVEDSRNYWAIYVDSMVSHYGDRVTVWEVWNEPNDTSKYWMPPDPGVYGSGTADFRRLCSLYVRLCRVADSVIKHVNGRAADKVLIGSMSNVDWVDARAGVFAGKELLRHCYDLTDTVFWDGVAIHTYQGGRTFRPAVFLANAETLRSIMHNNGDFGELWITEMGGRTGPTAGGGLAAAPLEQQAHLICEVFTLAKASEVLPSGGYDRTYWYSFFDYGDDFGLLGKAPGYVAKPAFHACRQTRDFVVGRRFNGRVLTGNPLTDDISRIYEFEEPVTGRRMWVCWRNGDARFGDREPPPVDVRIPVRTDVVEWEYCAYGPDNPGYQETSAADGWFDVSLTTRPRFIFEPVNVPITRPDLVVDSIRVEPGQPRAGMPMFITAWVRNQGNGFVPPGASAWVDFCWNDSLLKRLSTSWPDSVPEGGGELAFGIESVPFSMRGSGLLRVTANPGREFVELEHDNNSAFRVITVHGRSEP